MALLQTLIIKNFTLVENLEIDFNNGMTALTGETGAGKSLIVDALAMALGDRADTDQLRRAADKCEISAIFDISRVSLANSWLKMHDFDNPENECVIRRMLTKEGRSRGYINGQSATMQQLREIGETLIDIHNQHEHQSLLRRETHRHILDNFANCSELSKKTKRLHQEWVRTKDEFEKLRDSNIELISSKDFLLFQLQELKEIDISEGELQSLEEEQTSLANSESIISDCNTILQLYSEGETSNLDKLLNESIQILQKIPAKSESLEEAHRSLISAQIEIQESGKEIQQYLNNFNADPEALHRVEDRLTEIYHLARKYKISPENLYTKKKGIEDELKKLSVSHEKEDRLRQQTKKIFDEYMFAAKKLSEIRIKASIKISTDIEKQFKLLSMAGAQFKVSLKPIKNNDLGGRGQEEIEFLISSNPGEPCKPLARVASGGELSRISLAIHAIAAKNSPIPTLIFDEVDVGIGGATAEIVGSILQDLGRLGQILCITHQPQVASKAQNHMKVSKNTKDNLTYSNIVILDDSEKLNEIARMLGGVDITDATLGHAKEMLSSNEKN